MINRTNWRPRMALLQYKVCFAYHNQVKHYCWIKTKILLFGQKNSVTDYWLSKCGADCVSGLAAGSGQNCTGEISGNSISVLCWVRREIWRDYSDISLVQDKPAERRKSQHENVFFNLKDWKDPPDWPRQAVRRVIRCVVVTSTNSTGGNLQLSQKNHCYSLFTVCNVIKYSYKRKQKNCTTHVRIRTCK